MTATAPVAPEIIRLIRGLAHGLAHYHRRANLVHGDISPANIIITSGTKQLVLIDFGSAWPADAVVGASALAQCGALDPAYAPGTGTPVWGGLTSAQAAAILRGLAGIDVVGGDVVEVSPPFDTTGATAVAAAHVATEILCLWGWTRR